MQCGLFVCVGGSGGGGGCFVFTLFCFYVLFVFDFAVFVCFVSLLFDETTER